MPNINSSSLALRRKRLGYEQKQIAVLLGRKTANEICRYETGKRMPNFNEAAKLSILYGLPVHILFDRYFRRCREELEAKIKHSGLVAEINLESNPIVDFCSYLDLINSTDISESKDISEFNADKIRRHIKVLVEERSRKILGN